MQSRPELRGPEKAVLLHDIELCVLLSRVVKISANVSFTTSRCDEKESKAERGASSMVQALGKIWSGRGMTPGRRLEMPTTR